MYRHIIVAVDDSHTSRMALDEAIGLARLHHARLEIVHAVDESLVQAFNTHGVALVNARQLEQALVDNGNTVLSDALERARAAGVEAGTRLLATQDTHSADQIAEAVVDSGADLLVVGSHGRRGVRRLLLGSVAENLMRKVSISVLIVRGKHD